MGHHLRNLRRNKRKLYLCQKYIENGKDFFQEPVLIHENYLPTNSNGELISLGMEYPMYLKIKTSIREKDLFHPKDRLYVYKTPPVTHDALCNEADYEVYKEPLQFINEYEVMLKRLSDDNE